MSDEVYRLLEHDPTDRLEAMCDAYPQGLSVVTLSKPWGGCGVTIGWIAFQDMSVKQRLVDVQYFGAYGVNETYQPTNPPTHQPTNLTHQLFRHRMPGARK